MAALVQLGLEEARLTWADHGLIVLLVGILPVVIRHRYRKTRERRLRSPSARVGSYLQGALIEVELVLLCLALWGWMKRPLDLLGIRGFWGASSWVGAGAGLLFLLVSHSKARALRKRPEWREKLFRTVGTWDALVPRSGREMRAFLALTIVVGVSEELLFRGYCTWYLQAFLPPMGAIFVTPFLFGMAHLYQGPRGILATTVLGFVLSFLYLQAYSLWIPMAFHVAWNLLAARLAARTLAERERTEPALA